MRIGRPRAPPLTTSSCPTRLRRPSLRSFRNSSSRQAIPIPRIKPRMVKSKVEHPLWFRTSPPGKRWLEPRTWLPGSKVPPSRTKKGTSASRLALLENPPTFKEFMDMAVRGEKPELPTARETLQHTSQNLDKTKITKKDVYETVMLLFIGAVACAVYFGWDQKKRREKRAGKVQEANRQEESPAETVEVTDQPVRVVLEPDSRIVRAEGR